MNRLEAYKQPLYELRFSPMCKPAAEVANLTQLESHTTRARVLMMWRIAAGHLNWGKREAELMYESTLDSISQAFDVFEYPVSEFMLDARADIWDLGLAPGSVKQSVEKHTTANPFPMEAKNNTLILAGEIAQVEDQNYINILNMVIEHNGLQAGIWVQSSGALQFVLGARDAARELVKKIIEQVTANEVKMIIADGAETFWALTKMLEKLGLEFPKGIEILHFNTFLKQCKTSKTVLEKPFVHDSRPACLLADSLANHLAIMPGYLQDENVFGTGKIYCDAREIVDKYCTDRVIATWSRTLAKSCGADDGLWATHPQLASGLARQRLDYFKGINAKSIICPSPLCASYLNKQSLDDDLPIKWLPELLLD
ncbi:MAG: hypothetical protein JEZ06_12350 [Anaerolineaceae bacterium]|nr:hypothetical protein [Anaerolineaceae bacterium]